MSRQQPKSCSAGKTDFTKNWQTLSNTPDSMRPCQKIEAKYSRDMKALWLTWTLLLLLSVVPVQLFAQQTDADRKLFREIKAMAENGDADSLSLIGGCYQYGLLGQPTNT